MRNEALHATKTLNHTEIIQVSDIPVAEDEVSDWLTERFRLKDELLSDFLARGHFPNEGTEEELSTLKCVAKDRKSVV